MAQEKGPENVLICTLGESSPVVTEILDKLLYKLSTEEPPTQIRRVIVIHTNDPDVLEGPEDSRKSKPERIVRLKGFYALKDFFEGQNKDRYTYKVHGELKEVSPIKLCGALVHVNDIRDEKTNQIFADKLFEVILDEVERGNRVFLSIAGGRKTMSALAFLGGLLFGVHGLYHVLIDDKKIAANDFQYDVQPKVQGAGEYYELVEIPRLNLTHFILGTFASKRSILQNPELLDVDKSRLYTAILNWKRDQESAPLVQAVARKVDTLLGQRFRDLLGHFRQDPLPDPWRILLVSHDAQKLETDLWQYPSGFEGVFRYDQASPEDTLRRVGDPNDLTDLDLALVDVQEGGEDRASHWIRRFHLARPGVPMIAISALPLLEDISALTLSGASWVLDRNSLYELPAVLKSLSDPLLKPDRDIQIVDVSSPLQALETDPILPDLLRLLFPDADNAEIRVMNSREQGRGGTQNYWVWSKGPAAAFVKTGLPFNLAEEKNRYDRYVAGYIHNAAGRVERPAVRWKQQAAIAYTAVGTPSLTRDQPPDVVTLESYLRDGHGSWDEVRQILDQLFDRILNLWYTACRSIGLNPYTLYGNLLPPLYRLDFQDYLPASMTAMLGSEALDLSQSPPSLSSLVKPGAEVTLLQGRIVDLNVRETSGQMQLSHPTFGFKVGVDFADPSRLRSPKLHRNRPVSLRGKVTGSALSCLEERFRQVFPTLDVHARDLQLEGASLLNPLYYLDRVYTDMKERQLQTAWGIHHGDLNLGNILLEKGGSEPHVWLVDFARTGKGPLLFDFVKLETEIRTQVLSYLLQGQSQRNLQDLQSMEESLLNNQVPQVWQNSSACQTAFRAILHIREKAQQYCRCKNREDYLFPLFVYSLSTLKFRDLDKIDPTFHLPKKLALVAAAVSLQQFGVVL